MNSRKLCRDGIAKYGENRNERVQMKNSEKIELKKFTVVLPFGLY
jgi:hypothetical protein